MRIWDISPGYLNRQSLLGEHRELHGIVSIIVNKKKGYAKHPETIRWVRYGWALKMRHNLLACEMALRGYKDKSPVNILANKDLWPDVHIDSPERQIKLLKEKYLGKEQGRIPLPKNCQQLWSQHKYSVLARDPKLHKQIGQGASKSKIDFRKLLLLLTEALRERPTAGGIRNAVQHMWGYVSGGTSGGQTQINTWSIRKLLLETQKRAMTNNVEYLRTSTALSELMAWLPTAQ